MQLIILLCVCFISENSLYVLQHYVAIVFHPCPDWYWYGRGVPNICALYSGLCKTSANMYLYLTESKLYNRKI